MVTVCVSLFFDYFLFVTLATKSTKFSIRYLGEGSSEEGEIFQVVRGGIDVYHDPDWRPLVQGVPLGNQNIERCKKNL